MDTYHPTRARGAKATKVQRSREPRREMTTAERLLWHELRTLRSRGYPFRRQQIIAGFIVDFHCFPASLVIEVDGGVHERQTDYDAARDEVIAAHGLRILRITNAEVVEQLDDVMRRITAACALPS